jgi:hypothetical protein
LSGRTVRQFVHNLGILWDRGEWASRGFGFGCVAAKDAVRAAQPQIASARRSNFGDGRYFILRRIRRECEGVNLARIEPRQAQVKVERLQFPKLECQSIEIPVGPAHGSVDHQPERFHLRIGPAVAGNHRHLPHLLRDGALQPKVTVDHLTIRLSEDRHGEAKLADARPDLIDGLVVLSGIVLVGLQPFDGPVFDAKPGEGRR